MIDYIMAVKSGREGAFCKAFGGWALEGVKVKVRHAIFGGLEEAGRQGRREAWSSREKLVVGPPRPSSGVLRRSVGR